MATTLSETPTIPAEITTTPTKNNYNFSRDYYIWARRDDIISPSLRVGPLGARGGRALHVRRPRIGFFSCSSDDEMNESRRTAFLYPTAQISCTFANRNYQSLYSTERDDFDVCLQMFCFFPSWEPQFNTFYNMAKAGFYYTDKDLVVAHAKVMIHSALPHTAHLSV